MPSTSPWQPPSNYQAVASAVEGITVYAPRSTEEAAEAPVTFTCPQCGARTQYNVAAGGVACEHCGYQAPITAQPVGRQAAEYEFTLETLAKSDQGWGVARKMLRCDHCGAEVSLTEGALTATCPFCASNKVNVQTAAADQLRPRFLVPFKIQPETVQARVRTWLGRGWIHPDELGQAAGLNAFTGIYLPFWTFAACITARWKAEVGYAHTQSHYNSRTKSMETRTVIDWRWENGLAELAVADLLISGSAHVSRVILQKLNPFDLNDLAAYQPDFLAGWQAQAYDVPLPKAWDAGKEQMREQARAACRSQIQSTHIRNFSLTADFADETWRYILLPVYVAAYQFNAKVYQVMVNGQTGAVAGQKPVAWWKIWLAVAALLSPGLCLALVGLPLLLAGGVGVIPLAIGGLLFLAGLAAAVALYQYASHAEAA